VRQTYNANNTILQPDSAGIEETPADRYIDILSNGFKLRQNGQQINRSGASYIFMALAEHPFRRGKCFARYRTITTTNNYVF
jgi:hypothetical protein